MNTPEILVLAVFLLLAGAVIERAATNHLHDECATSGKPCSVCHRWIGPKTQ